ncbi:MULTISPECIES: RNA polymerase sigma factor [unclassified Pseudoalteromonas]|uniref:RNA polymerase sigma factor n=1 Tax=unclassified Pseudoalteromonas TaxID=194690 RepID=UPI00110B5476|nr:sigma-70 family RNA polymerase sigma factor [Pseudoalteromonas sp. S4492]TMO27064.1 RNA polymerase subunit sigma-24 [Pseudoalteromonas sp. S4492]
MERYYAEVLNYISRSVGCKEKAQNIVQEAYLRILNHKKNNPNHDSTQQRALFFTTAKNIVIDQYRKKRKVTEEAELDLIAPADFEPESKLAAQQQLKQLYQCIEQLPQKTKQAFVLYKFKNLSQHQIASQMNISVSMVEKHLATAMMLCRETLNRK